MVTLMRDVLLAGLKASLCRKYLLSTSSNTCLEAGGAQGSQNKSGQVRRSRNFPLKLAEETSLLDMFSTDVLGIANDFNSKI